MSQRVEEGAASGGYNYGAVDGDEKDSGEGIPFLASLIGTTLSRSNKWLAEAITWLKKALLLLKRQHGKRYDGMVETAYVLMTMGQVYRQKANLADSLKSYKHALGVFSKVL